MGGDGENVLGLPRHSGHEKEEKEITLMSYVP